MNHRPLRVANLLRDEIGQMLLREMEFPGALVTVTEIVIDDKLDLARVRVSVIPSKKSEEVFMSLRKAQGYLQHLLGKKVNIRPMPFIRFEIDEGLEKAARIEKVLINAPLPEEEGSAPAKRVPKRRKLVVRVKGGKKATPKKGKR